MVVLGNMKAMTMALERILSLPLKDNMHICTYIYIYIYIFHVTARPVERPERLLAELGLAKENPSTNRHTA